MGLEDISMFRAVPNSTVFYPSDAVSTERAVELAANTKVSTLCKCIPLKYLKCTFTIKGFFLKKCKALVSIILDVSIISDGKNILNLHNYKIANGE